MYQRDELYGGHVIMLGKNCDAAALSALRAFPNGMHIGGMYLTALMIRDSITKVHVQVESRQRLLNGTWKLARLM